jgi:hypothetical protein
MMTATVSDGVESHAEGTDADDVFADGRRVCEYATDYKLGAKHEAKNLLTLEDYNLGIGKSSKWSVRPEDALSCTPIIILPLQVNRKGQSISARFHLLTLRGLEKTVRRACFSPLTLSGSGKTAHCVCLHTR